MFKSPDLKNNIFIDVEGKTAQDYALELDNKYIAQLLLNQEFIESSKYGDAENVKILLQNPRIQVITKGVNGKTALEWAKIGGYSDIVNMIEDVITKNKGITEKHFSYTFVITMTTCVLIWHV